jgi:hypothetical protein
MKEIRFQCKDCKQVIEVPDSMRGQWLECPSCHSSLQVPKGTGYRPSALFLVLSALIGLFGWAQLAMLKESNAYSEKSLGKIEDRSEHFEHMHQQARDEITKAVYEARPGVTRIVDVQLLDYTDRPADWRATVAVDYRNERGGIQRTNVYLVFGSALYGNVFCMEDRAKLFEIWKQSLDR